MKKILISVLFLFVTMVSYSQIKVLSIEPDEADLTARINPKQDRNGFNCAMLRITTMGVNGEQRRKFRFSGDMATQIVDVSFPEGEIWVYLSPGRSSLIIVHDDYGREIYDMPYELKEKTCYRMVITVDKEDIVKNYLIIKADQPNALIYVDDVFMGEKEVAQLYSAGDTHKWRIECDMYHSESGEAKISYTGNTVVEKTLRPAFGYFNLTTKPETGATVYVDGKKTGETPYFIPSGPISVWSSGFCSILNTCTLTLGESNIRRCFPNVLGKSMKKRSADLFHSLSPHENGDLQCQKA